MPSALWLAALQLAESGRDGGAAAGRPAAHDAKNL